MWSGLHNQGGTFVFTDGTPYTQHPADQLTSGTCVYLTQTQMRTANTCNRNYAYICVCPREFFPPWRTRRGRVKVIY